MNIHTYIPIPPSFWRFHKLAPHQHPRPTELPSGTVADGIWPWAPKQQGRQDTQGLHTSRVARTTRHMWHHRRQRGGVRTHPVSGARDLWMHTMDGFTFNEVKIQPMPGTMHEDEVVHRGGVRMFSAYPLDASTKKGHGLGHG